MRRINGEIKRFIKILLDDELFLMTRIGAIKEAMETYEYNKSQT